MTREHVLPSALADLLPIPAGVTRHQYLMGASSVSSKEIDVAHREIASSIFDIVVRAVCSSCNSKWMEQGQGEIKRLIAGERFLLGEGEQALVSRWAVKTAMTFDKNGISCVPSAHHRSFYNKRIPPPGWQVWIGSHDAFDWRTRPWSIGIDTSQTRLLSLRFAYAAVFGLGHTMLLITGNGGDRYFSLPWANDFLVPIWPFRAEVQVPIRPKLHSGDMPYVCLQGWTNYCRSLGIPAPETSFEAPTADLMHMGDFIHVTQIDPGEEDPQT